MRWPVPSLALGLIPLALLSGCGLTIELSTPRGEPGSGRIVEAVRPVDAFRRVEVQSALHAVVTLGDTAGVTVKGDDNLVPLVETTVTEGRLVVGLRANSAISPSQPLKVLITVTGLDAITAAGATEVEVRDVPGERLVAKAEGAAKLSITGLDADRAELVSEGASHLKLTGRARTLSATAEGASNIEAGSVPAATVTVDASGASGITVTASESVRGSAEGASTVTVVGAVPEVAVSKSGAASVSRREGKSEPE